MQAVQWLLSEERKRGEGSALGLEEESGYCTRSASTVVPTAVCNGAPGPNETKLKWEEDGRARDVILNYGQHKVLVSARFSDMLCLVLIVGGVAQPYVHTGSPSPLEAKPSSSGHAI